jgi:hypothetical protein
MAEVGLLPFARIALQVSKAVLPRYRSPFRKHQFTRPQLLALLCLMRYEDWTFREAEVRLAEHGELRRVLGLSSVPDFTTLYRFLQRLDDPTIDRSAGETCVGLCVLRISFDCPLKELQSSAQSLGRPPVPTISPF